MTITRRIPPKKPILILNYVAGIAFTSLQYTLVAPNGASSGKVGVTTAPSQGGLTWGVIQNPVASGGQAEVMRLGVTPVVAAESFDSGVELTCAGTGGRVEEAASGDFICGFAQEASAEEDQLIAMELCMGYYKD